MVVCIKKKTIPTCFRYLLLYKKLPQYLVVSKNMHLLFHSVCIHESRHSSAGASASGSLTKLQSRCWPKVSQKASVKVNWAMSTSKTKVTLLSSPFMEMTLHYFCIFTRNKLPSPAHSRRERITGDMPTRKWGSLRAIFEICLPLLSGDSSMYQGWEPLLSNKDVKKSIPYLNFLKHNFLSLFLAVLDLHHCSGFSLVAIGRGYSSLRWAGFSFLWPLLLRSTGSRAQASGVAVPRFWSSGSIVVAHGPSSVHSMWDLPGSGIEVMTLGLAGGFFTTTLPFFTTTLPFWVTTETPLSQLDWRLMNLEWWKGLWGYIWALWEQGGSWAVTSAKVKACGKCGCCHP